MNDRDHVGTLRRHIARTRADLSETLLRVDSRRIPQDALLSIEEAHNSLNMAVAHLKRVEVVQQAYEGDDYV